MVVASSVPWGSAVIGAATGRTGARGSTADAAGVSELSGWDDVDGPDAGLGGSCVGEDDGTPIEGARDGIDGGLGKALRTGGAGVEVASPPSDAGSTPGGTGSLERTGGDGGGAFDRSGGGGGWLAFAGDGFAVPLVRTGAGGGVDLPAVGRGMDAFGFLIDSPSSAIGRKPSLTRLARR
ncbi:MAG TPA: hypothetical protein VIW29_11960 [Polyangiaceae bacterium]